MYKTKKFIFACISVTAVLVIALFLTARNIVQEKKYTAALKLLNDGHYNEAESAFYELLTSVSSIARETGNDRARIIEKGRKRGFEYVEIQTEGYLAYKDSGEKILLAREKLIEEYYQLFSDMADNARNPKYYILETPDCPISYSENARNTEYHFGLRNGFSSTFASDWAVRRKNSMNDQVARRGLSDYYDSMEAKPAPIDVKGFGFYVNPESRLARTVGFAEKLADFYLPAFAIADKPENARYAISENTRYEYAFDLYNAQNEVYKAYGADVRVIVKDSKNGEIVFDRQWHENAPEQIMEPLANRADMTYKAYPFGEIKEELVPFLKELIDNWK